ncbi:hypothetical protein niasHT_023413 [Heterodera trifolii]|uniref:Uncharacterized protein n=1 Tax=Heterodera trifolii TaxID=157864 RepID=A0ABD2K4H9_9BILA
MKNLPPELLSEMTLYILYPNKNFPNLFSSSWLLREFLIPHVTKRKEILKKRRNALREIYNRAKLEQVWVCFLSSTGQEKQKQTIDNFLFYLEDYIGYAISNPPTVKEEKKLSKQAQILYFAFFDCEETFAWKCFKAYANLSPTVQQFLDELSSFFALALDLSPEHSQLMSSADFSQALLDVPESVPEVSTVPSTSAPLPQPVVTEPVLEESTYGQPFNDRPLRFISTMAKLEAHRSTNISDIVARLTSIVGTNDLTRLPPDVVGHLDAAVTHLEASAQRLNLDGGQSDDNSKMSKFRKFVATFKKKNSK